ncbi:MAG: SMI1/KNR4 family protein [Lachnospiraceae bacterium]|nr:SMI1/KNR4 family protein [Lachnospiraceae bacterium]
MKFCDFLEKQDGLVMSGGKDEDSISEAENILRAPFADEYKSYLRKYGAVSYDGHELTGLIRSKRLNVVDCTIKQREENDCILPDMYVVENLGIDGIVVLQASNGKVYMLYSYDNEIREVANSLLEYLQKG